MATVTGPVERSAVKLVAALVWPGNAASRILGRAVVLAARRVDEAPGRARWRDELAEAVAELRACPSDAGVLAELQANYLLRRCSVTEVDLVATARLFGTGGEPAPVVSLRRPDESGAV